MDCYVSNHPFVDLAYLKLEIVRRIVDGVNNPFVSSPAAVRECLEMFRGRAIDAQKQRAAGVEFKM